MANVINAILMNEIPIKGIVGSKKKTIWVSYESDFINPRITINCAGYIAKGTGVNMTREIYQSASPSEIYPCNFTYKGITYNAVGRCDAVGLAGDSTQLHRCFVRLYDGESTTVAYSKTLEFQMNKNYSPGFTYFVGIYDTYNLNSNQTIGTIYRFNTNSISSGLATSSNITYFNQLQGISTRPIGYKNPVSGKKIIGYTCNAKWVNNLEWQENLSELGVTDINYLSPFTDSNGYLLESAPLCYVEGAHTPVDSTDTIWQDFRITCAWSNSFKLTLYPNGGECDISEISAELNTEWGNLPTPIRYGFRFIGWFTDIDSEDEILSSTIATSDLTAYAHWEQITHTVTLNTDGGEANPNVIIKNHGETIGELPIPIKSGYNFLGWYLNNSQINDNYQVVSDITLLAKWDINSYTVEFVSNVEGLTVPSQQIEYNETATQPSVNNYGYDLDGWYIDSEFTDKFDFATPITNDIILYAKWFPKTIIVNLNPNGGQCEINQIDITFNEPYGELPIPTYDGHTFLGWKLNDNIITDESICNIAETHTLIAEWSIEQYTITYISNIDGIDISPQIVDYGTVITPPNITNRGYNLGGWYIYNDFIDEFDFSIPITSDITLYAQWIPITITVHFNANGGKCDVTEKQLDYDMIYGTLPTPVSDKQDFLGWYYNDKLITTTTICNEVENHTLVAKWGRIPIGYYNEIPFYDIYIGDKHSKQVNKGDLPIIII